jgi:hypothetical protein
MKAFLVPDRLWSGVSVIVLAFAAVACGADCAQLCEDSKKCNGGPEKGTDCEKACEDAEKTAESAGCENQYEEALGCRDDQEDVCKADDACASESKALAECVGE